MARTHGTRKAEGLARQRLDRGWQVLVEPTDRSFQKAIEFAADAAVDGFVSVGGGSVMGECLPHRSRRAGRAGGALWKALWKELCMNIL